MDKNKHAIVYITKLIYICNLIVMHPVKQTKATLTVEELANETQINHIDFSTMDKSLRNWVDFSVDVEFDKMYIEKYPSKIN